jgi:hypothetical protein
MSHEVTTDGVTDEAAAEPEAQEPLADPHEPVHARYIGETRIWMPDLERRLREGIPRCCELHPENEKTAEYEQWLAHGREGFDPRMVLEHGDVLLLDRHSAEGRSDFELMPEGDLASNPTRADLVAAADRLGIDVPSRATKPEIRTLIEEANARSDQGAGTDEKE